MTETNAIAVAARNLADARARVEAAETERTRAHRDELLWLALADGRLDFAAFKAARANTLVRVVFGLHHRRLVIDVIDGDDETVRDFFTGEEVFED
jgi:hypothetical protein